MLVTGYAGYKLYQEYMFQFITICLVKGDEIVRPRDRHSNETDSQETCYKIYKHRKWMVEVFRKFYNQKLLELTCILSQNLSIYCYLL